MYFSAGAHIDKGARWSDEDYTHKSYMVVDLDIRMEMFTKENRVIDQDELLSIGNDILSSIPWKPKYVVDSGNWLHLYYVGDEIEISHSEYRDGVSYFFWLFNAQSPIDADHACCNISRVMRLPWSINRRQKRDLWNLWEYECKIIQYNEDSSDIYNQIKSFAKKWRQEKELSRKIRMDARNHRDDDIFSEINEIPCYDIVEEIYGVKMKRWWWDTHAFDEGKKNMGAYWYEPYNLFVNTWSSLIRNKDIPYFTTWKLVKEEMFNGDARDAMNYFKDKHGIDVKIPWQVPERREYDIKWYIFWFPVFEELECLTSGELVIVYSKSNSGKTTMCMNMIKQNAKLGRKSFYINLEFDIRTVARNRWLFDNGKSKINLTDLEPLTDDEQMRMDLFITNYLNSFDYYNAPQGIDLDWLVDKIVEKYEEWYELFVVDTLSRIQGTLDASSKYSKQNEIMEKLQELVQNTGICLILLHHTNKKGELEGSQKIVDLANVVIQLKKEEDPFGDTISKLLLEKDKYVDYKEIEFIYKNGQYLTNDL